MTTVTGSLVAAELRVHLRYPLRQLADPHVVVVTDVRGGGDGLDAVAGGHSAHRQRVGEVERPVIDAGQDVAVEVDHAASIADYGVELPEAFAATNAATSCASFPVTRFRGMLPLGPVPCPLA